MDKLGKSVECYKNYGAKFAFCSMVVIILFLIGFFLFVDVKIDSLGISLFFFVIIMFSCLAVYMYFKAKTEIDLRERGIFIRNVTNKHEIAYDEIAKLDKTRRVGKRGNKIIMFYLLVIEKKDGERITLPFRISNEFLEKLFELAQFNE